ncbi:hypothetical protein KRM28CT15_46600 [Krasilnikovia sp. M28-CT-15]
MSENVAYRDRTTSETMKAWVASPGHRRKTLDCRAEARAVGVYDYANGTNFYTREFGWR